MSDHILVGGYYKSINGSSANPYMTSLNPTTGKDDGFVHLNISGHYQYPGVSVNATKVYNQALSHSGKLDLVMGDFTSVGGVKRQQIFMLNVGGSQSEGDRLDLARFQRSLRDRLSRSTSGRHPGRRMTPRSTSPLRAATTQPAPERSFR